MNVGTLLFVVGLCRCEPFRPHYMSNHVTSRLHPPRNYYNETVARDLLNLDNAANVYWSQIGQDKFVDRLLHEKRDGFFVEAGASDGETLSNTLFFEVSRGWTGLLVEANPFVFTQLLSKGRNAYAFEGALSTTRQIQEEQFLVAGEFGGLRDAISTRHKQRIDRETPLWQNLKTWKNVGYLVKVLCVPLPTILRNIQKTHVDFLSLDVEGAELAILETIVDSPDITIDVIAVETNGQAEQIGTLLLKHDFVRVGSLSDQDDVWRNKRFNL